MAGHNGSPARDQSRHAIQAPIASPRFCVVYLKDGREKTTPWFSNHGCAQKALSLMQEQCGHGNAVILRD